jgi:hypothetical protein
MMSCADSADAAYTGHWGVIRPEVHSAAASTASAINRVVSDVNNISMATGTAEETARKRAFISGASKDELQAVLCIDHTDNATMTR